jgi:flagellar basal-body rod modification protein FlgD
MTTTSQVNAINSAGAAQSTSSQGVLGKNDFLKLLITQLRNQDPLNPMEGTEFAAQLAQFSSLEQMTNINTNLTSSLESTTILTQAISNALSTTMIGKEVKAAVSQITYGGSGEVRLGYTLPSAAAKVVVRIQDATGSTVRTIAASGLTKGDNKYTWDGKNDSGTAVQAGQYRISVEATDADGNTLSTSSFVYGLVSSVRFKSTGTMFVVDGMEIPLSQVLEILNG